MGRMRILLLVLGPLAAVLVGAGPAATAQAAADPSPGVWPLPPRPPVVSGFDPPETRWGRGHRGVDLGSRAGQVVRSALPGRISFASPLAGRGVVVVDHGATRTTYEPVVADVRVGDRVAAGQPIGRLETRGSHCLPAACLHWGWRRGETYLDPLGLVGGGPVRLVPIAGLGPGPPGTSGVGSRVVRAPPTVVVPAGGPGAETPAAVLTRVGGLVGRHGAAGRW